MDSFPPPVAAAVTATRLRRSQAEPAPAIPGGRSVMTTALRNTGIEPVGEMPWGTHFCHFYETRDDLLETLLPFFKAGLESNEFCAWVFSEPLTEQDGWQPLDRPVAGLHRDVSCQCIEVLHD